MATLNEYVQAQLDRGLTQPADVADAIMVELRRLPPSELWGFVRSLLAPMVVVQYSRRRMGMPDRVRRAATTGRTRIVRDAYSEMIPVGGVWKRIGDCTRLDLTDYAAMLRDHAGATIRKAEWFERLASKLPDDTTTVRQARLDLTA